ncbi:hypothetical protein EDB89DRAFT_1992901 [Lactarius sanguifluus]|nr:hypothetical protein EDB89DRAFT_1992901 [Lactarius sanguifluus]
MVTNWVSAQCIKISFCLLVLVHIVSDGFAPCLSSTCKKHPPPPRYTSAPPPPFTSPPTPLPRHAVQDPPRHCAIPTLKTTPNAMRKTRYDATPNPVWKTRYDTNPFLASPAMTPPKHGAQKTSPTCSNATSHSAQDHTARTMPMTPTPTHWPTTT